MYVGCLIAIFLKKKIFLFCFPCDQMGGLISTYYIYVRRVFNIHIFRLKENGVKACILYEKWLDARASGACILYI
jgi:hypothetical protein